MWHDTPLDEHPPADVGQGMNTIWQAIHAVVRAGLWDRMVFLLTWDDWGGYDDHVATPDLKHTPDGVQFAYGPRVPLLMFGGRARAGIDSRWCSHVSIPKTALQLLGLPALGVPRLDDDHSLADLVDLGSGAKRTHRPRPSEPRSRNRRHRTRSPCRRRFHPHRPAAPSRSAGSCCAAAKPSRHRTTSLQTRPRLTRSHRSSVQSGRNLE